MSTDRTSAPGPVAGNIGMQTQEVRVRAYVRNGAVLEGNAHVTPGGYQGRVSDVLNRGNMRYLPITEVAYAAPDGEARTSECVLVNIDDIVLLDAAPGSSPGTPPTG